MNWPFGNKNKKNGFTFTDERVAELEKARDMILTEYKYLDSIKSTKNRVIRLSDKFSDSRELIAFYGLKADKCVVVLGYSGESIYDLNVVPLINRDIAGVFATHEKDKKISFPDGIGENVHLYNVSVIHKKDEVINISKKHFDLFTLPSKTLLLKTIFGKEQRNRNQNIENFLISMYVIREQDHVYFYMVTKASKNVRDKILGFKEQFYSLKNKSIFTDKVYPRVPDEVHGGHFDWEKAKKDASEGININKFYGELFYETLSNKFPKLKSILNKEYDRVRFIEQFPTLEDQLTSQGNVNGFGELGKYAYIPIDRARYDYFSATSLRGSTDRNHCFWDSFLRDLECIYTNDLPEKYSGRSDKKVQEQKLNKSFYIICNEMIDGLAYADDEVISYINFNSSTDIVKQIKPGTTFSFVKEPIVDTQNKKIKELMYFSVYDYFKQMLNKSLNENFIANDQYLII